MTPSECNFWSERQTWWMCGDRSGNEHTHTPHYYTCHTSRRPQRIITHSSYPKRRAVQAQKACISKQTINFPISYNHIMTVMDLRHLHTHTHATRIRHGLEREWKRMHVGIEVIDSQAGDTFFLFLMCATNRARGIAEWQACIGCNVGQEDICSQLAASDSTMTLTACAKNHRSALEICRSMTMQMN